MIIYLFQVTLGLVCICRLFSSRIYVADLRRDSTSPYFRKRGVTTKPGLLVEIVILLSCRVALFKEASHLPKATIHRCSEAAVATASCADAVTTSWLAAVSASDPCVPPVEGEEEVEKGE